MARCLLAYTRHSPQVSPSHVILFRVSLYFQETPRCQRRFRHREPHFARMRNSRCRRLLFAQVSGMENKKEYALPYILPPPLSSMIFFTPGWRSSGSGAARRSAIFLRPPLPFFRIYLPMAARLPSVIPSLESSINSLSSLHIHDSLDVGGTNIVACNFHLF